MAIVSSAGINLNRYVLERRYFRNHVMIFTWRSIGAAIKADNQGPVVLG